MSVLRCSRARGREGDIGSITDSRTTLNWLVQTDSKFENEFSVIAQCAALGAAGDYVPLPMLSLHPDSNLMLCRRVRARQRVPEVLWWDLTAEYSSEPIPFSQQERESQPVPMDRRARISWVTVQYQKPSLVDINGNAFTNSAGDYFDPPPERDASHWVVTIRKNVIAVPTWILDYEDAINDAAMTIQGVSVAKECAKIMRLSIGELQVENGYEFYEFAYELELHRQQRARNASGVMTNFPGWKHLELDQGFREKDPNDATKRIQIKDDSETPQDITSPALLDGSGARLADPAKTNGRFLPFDDYPSKDFSVLPGIGDNP